MGNNPYKSVAANYPVLTPGQKKFMRGAFVPFNRSRNGRFRKSEWSAFDLNMQMHADREQLEKRALLRDREGKQTDLAGFRSHPTSLFSLSTER